MLATTRQQGQAEHSLRIARMMTEEKLYVPQGRISTATDTLVSSETLQPVSAVDTGERFYRMASDLRTQTPAFRGQSGDTHNEHAFLRNNISNGAIKEMRTSGLH